MSFDILAPHYRWMEFVLAGEKLHRCRVAFLDQISTPREILLLGEGPGRCLLECRRRFPSARITCLDASASMLHAARRRLERHNLSGPAIEFIHADISDHDLGLAKFDLIITHFFLDCFPADKLDQIVLRIAAAATPRANWLLADFQSPVAGLSRLRGRLIIWTMYTFFRLVTRIPARRLAVPDPFIQRNGFKLVRRAESEWGLLHSDWWRRG